MKFIVIELFPLPTIVTNKQGIPLIYDAEYKAKLEAHFCQDGMVIPIPDCKVSDNYGPSRISSIKQIASTDKG